MAATLLTAGVGMGTIAYESGWHACDVKIESGSQASAKCSVMTKAAEPTKSKPLGKVRVFKKKTIECRFVVEMRTQKGRYGSELLPLQQQNAGG